MTREEMMEMRVGDVAYVPFYVDAVDDIRCRVVAVRLAEKEAHDRGEKDVVRIYYFDPVYIEFYKRPRRRFRVGDVVLLDGGADVVVSEESDSREVKLKGFPVAVDAKVLTLLMSAEEVEKIAQEKGE